MLRYKFEEERKNSVTHLEASQYSGNGITTSRILTLYVLNTEQRQNLRITESKGCCVHVETGCRSLYFTCGNQMESCSLRREGKREEVKAVPKKYHKYVTRWRNSWLESQDSRNYCGLIRVRKFCHIGADRKKKGKALLYFLLSTLLFSTKLGVMNSWWEYRHLMTERKNVALLPEHDGGNDSLKHSTDFSTICLLQYPL